MHSVCLYINVLFGYTHPKQKYIRRARDKGIGFFEQKLGLWNFVRHSEKKDPHTDKNPNPKYIRKAIFLIMNSYNHNNGIVIITHSQYLCQFTRLNQNDIFTIIFSSSVRSALFVIVHFASPLSLMSSTMKMIIIYFILYY